MKQEKRRSPRMILVVTTFALIVSLGATQSYGQPYFSIDFQGPTVGGGANTAGDVLFSGGAPAVIPFTAFGLAPSPWTGQVEIDALSKCSRALLGPPSYPMINPPMFEIEFTVDEFASGIATSPLAPNVTSEGATGWREASADIYQFLGTTMPPMVIPPGVTGNTALWDGNGFGPFGGPGLGLVERNPPRFGIPDRGDNLDALMYPNTRSQRVYLSLDANWIDPLEGLPANSGTAAANGFAPGDILVYIPGATPAVRVYAAFWQLGLGPDDDVDALIVHESGDGNYKPSQLPYDWEDPNIPFVGTDMLLFSVRRGSPIIGTLDSLRGLTIEEGDVLTVMNGGTTVPGILAPAEALGLRTVRGGYKLPHGYADDLVGMAVNPYLENPEDPSNPYLVNPACDPLPQP